MAAAAVSCCCGCGDRVTDDTEDVSWIGSPFSTSGISESVGQMHP